MKNFLLFCFILFSLQLFSQNATLEFGDGYKGGKLVNGSQQRLVKTSDTGGILYLYLGTGAIELKRINPQLDLVDQNKISFNTNAGIVKFIDLVSVDESVLLFTSVWNKKKRTYSLRRQEININTLVPEGEGDILFTVPAKNYREQGDFQVVLSPNGKRLLAHGFNKPSDLNEQQEIVQVYEGTKLEWEKRFTENPNRLDRKIQLTNRGEVILCRVSLRYNYVVPRSRIDCKIFFDYGQTEREISLEKEDQLLTAPTFEISDKKELICSGVLTTTDREAEALFLYRYDLIRENYLQQTILDFDQLGEAGDWQNQIIGGSAPLVENIILQENGGVIVVAPFQQYVKRRTTVKEVSPLRTEEVSSSVNINFNYGDICVMRIDKAGQLDWIELVKVTPAIHDYALEEPYYFALFPSHLVFIWGTQLPKEWPRPRSKGGAIMMTTINTAGEQKQQRLYSQSGDNGVLLHLTTGMEQIGNELLFQVYKWEGPYMVRVKVEF